MPAIKYTKTAVDTDDAWDAGKAEKAIPNDAKADTLRKEYAWQEPDADADTKSAYKFPHHFVGDDGSIGDASSKACSAGIAALNGGRGGAKIPDADRKGVYNHLAHHLKDAGLDVPELNSFDADAKSALHKETFQISKNAFEADDKTGTITFPMGQVVMDGQTLRSGARYDMASLDPSEFNGSVTADHAPFIGSIVAKTQLYKRGGELLMNAITFAVKENPLGQIAYDLYKNGFAHDFSIETYGPWPEYDEEDDDSEGVFKDAQVCGLSCVVTGNSTVATMSLYRNSLDPARKNGLDTTEAEQALGVNAVEEPVTPVEPTPQPVAPVEPVTPAPEITPPAPAEPPQPEVPAPAPVADPVVTPPAEATNTNPKQEDDMKFVTVENSRDFAISVKYKNAADKEIETELAPGASVDVSEDQKEALESQINSAKNEAEELDKFGKALNAALEAQNKKFDEKIESLTQNLLDKSAVEPEFHADPSAKDKKLNYTSSQLEEMGWEERTVEQMLAAYRANKFNDPEATKKLWAINNFNFNEMKKTNKKYNALSIDDLGNFVIPPELVTQIFGHVSNFQPLLEKFNFQETLSMITSWIVRTNRLHMTDVDMQDVGTGDDLKALSLPTYQTYSETLQEFASVTPVDASAIRFSAADIMQDITNQYKWAYDEALATSIIGRLEAAVQANGQSENFTVSTSATDALTSMLDVWSPIVEWVPNGIFMMTQATVLQLMKYALEAGPNGPLANIFTTGQDNVPRFFNLPYVIVPSQIMPSLNTASGQQPSLTFEGTSVTVHSSILLANPDNFMGRVSGGLQFQVSTEAAYEESGTVKSAFQRDKLVFRGYGYRKSAITLPTDVAGVTSVVVS